MPADRSPADPRREQPPDPGRPGHLPGAGSGPPLEPGQPAWGGSDDENHQLLALEVAFVASARDASGIRDGLAALADDLAERGAGHLIPALPAVSIQPGWRPGLEQVRLRWVRVPEPEVWLAGAKVLCMLSDLWQHLGLDAPPSARMKVLPDDQVRALELAA